MGSMMSQGSDDSADASGDNPPPKKKKCKGGLGGMLAGAMGAGC
jgi:hypothetical protein